MPHRIRHAKAYPFPIPERSYVYDNGATREFDPTRFSPGARVPVLAAGSNQSPEQVHRKFGELEGGAVIPSQRGRLHGFDVVYAAHLAGYGSVPATFQGSPGTTVTVFVQWLNGPELERMHATEGNYSYDHLTGITIELDDGHGTLTEAYAYSSKFGCLNHDGAPVGLAEIFAGGRRFAEATQPEMLARLRDRLAPGRDIDEFILDHVKDRETLRARSRAVAEDALPLDFKRHVVTTLGTL